MKISTQHISTFGNSEKPFEGMDQGGLNQRGCFLRRFRFEASKEQMLANKGVFLIFQHVGSFLYLFKRLSSSGEV